MEKFQKFTKNIKNETFAEKSNSEGIDYSTGVTDFTRFVVYFL